MSKHDRTTLITGGTGKTGRRVAAQLARQGVRCRIGSRRGDPPFDWAAPHTWAPALAGVTSVYLTYYPDLAMPGAGESIGAFTALARESGTEHVVLLSGRGEPEAQRSERIVQESGVDWTVLRCSAFAQNFSESFLLAPVRSGTIRFPAGDNAEPFIDVEDVADAAVNALSQPRHRGRVYEMTGPQLLSFAEAAKEISSTIGRPVTYEPITADEYGAMAAEQLQVPPDQAHDLAQMLATIFDGHNASVTDGARQVLGREPRDFSQFVRDAAATGVWDA